MNHVDTHLASRRPDPGRPAEATLLDAARQSIVVEFIAHLRNGSGLMVLLGRPGSGRSTILRQVASEAAAQQLPRGEPRRRERELERAVDVRGGNALHALQRPDPALRLLGLSCLRVVGIWSIIF